MTMEAKTVEMQIAKGRLDSYSAFVSIHSDNGRYNPEKGADGLLSALTPDAKCVVLTAMENGDTYFTDRQLHRATLNWLEGIGLDKGIFPLTHSSTWNYCGCRDIKGNIVNGSLVDRGIVEKVCETTPEGLEIEYRISSAGRDLAVPLCLNAMEFVYKARDSIPHSYDSMWRIFSGVNSKTEKRRQLAVYKIIRFLIENPVNHRYKDIMKAFEGDIDDIVVSRILNSLGHCGIIDYESPERDVGGRRARGFITFHMGKMMSLDEIYGEIRKRKPDFYNRGYLSTIVEFIKANPDLEYERNYLSGKLGILPNCVSTTLSALTDIGVLKRKTEFRGHETCSRTRANDLTRMLYDDVLEPTWYSANTLTPIERKNLNPEKMGIFLENYQAERSQIGLQGGKEVRDIILNLLSDSNGMKLSHIVEEGNKLLGRRGLNVKTFEYHLDSLIKQRLVKRIEGCHYGLDHQ